MKKQILLGSALAIVVAIFGIATAADFHTHTSDEALLPDLSITSVIFDSNTGNPVVTIKNIGRADAGAKRQKRAFKVEFGWQSEYFESQKVEMWVPTLKKGASSKIKFPTASAVHLRPLNRSSNLTVTLDTTNLIQEEFENNNMWRGNIEKPDLFVDSVVHDSTFEKLTVFVKNQGLVRAGRKYEVGVAKLSHWWLDYYGDQIGNKLTEKFSSLGVGESQKIEWTLGKRNYQGKPEGAATLVMKADEDEVIMEKDEDNNVWAEEIGDGEYIVPCDPNSDTEECTEENIDSDLPEDSQPAMDESSNNANQSGDQPPVQEPPPAQTPANPPAEQQPGQSGQNNPPAVPPADTRWHSNSDLILLPGSVYFRPTPATQGVDIKFWATVKNVGAGPTGQLTRPSVGRVGDGDSDIYLKIDLGSDGTWDVIKTTYTPALYQEHISLKNFSSWRAIRGNHTYQICADGEDAVWETDETNNCVTNTFSVE